MVFKYGRSKFFRENILMKIHTLIFMILLTLLLIPYGTVYGENRIEYTIQIGSDGSAAWIIKQTGTDIQASFDTLVELENRVTSLVEAAKSKTGRNMAVSSDTLSITSTISGSYVTVEYGFFWENFCKTENTSIIIGDVFQVKDFFLNFTATVKFT